MFNLPRRETVTLAACPLPPAPCRLPHPASRLPPAACRLPHPAHQVLTLSSHVFVNTKYVRSRDAAVIAWHELYCTRLNSST